jgi:tRNA-2-methylthio-N6-dimethylallyladenosine synthase
VGRRRYEREVGRRVQVLVEGPSRRNAARLEGRTGTNKLVVFEGNERHLGQVLEMKVVRTGSFTLYGDPAILNLEEEAEGGRAGET